MERNNNIIGSEPFTYAHFDKIEPTTFHMQCIFKDVKTTLTSLTLNYTSNFPNCTCGITTAYFVGELEIPVLDNECIFSILTKHFYDLHEILHRCLRIFQQRRQ